ncbi:oxygen-regulated protein 1-like isoform X1 [Pleurodeles waltl]|uniref:oxygen-regulated protein 1-like isoform X1 n=1 Tax=Pleurodeles waltl TaxID=8319 RepID=UPI003709A7CB
MSESTTTSYSGLQPYSSESAQTASTRHSNVTEPVVSKRVCFYKSGDPQFNGIKMVVSNRSFKTFDALLDGLSKKVPLPFGVRNISTPRGIHQVSALDELEDGKSYICSHQKKIKPVNLERASRKPLLWQSSRPISARRRVVQLLRQNEVNPAPGDNTAVPGLSKKLVIFKNGDTGFKHTIILSKKNTQNFEALLDHMTEVMQCPVTKLYTADGRRIFGMQALLLSSGAIVAAGREPFKPRNYDPKKESLPVKLPGIPRRVLPKARNKPEPRNLLKASEQTTSTPRSSIHSLSSDKTHTVDTKCVDMPCVPENDINFSANQLLPGEELPLMYSDDDIEKSVHVNPDGTMTVEMKIRLRIKSDETIQWTTTVSRANISRESNLIPCSTTGQGTQSPDHNSIAHKAIEEDSSLENSHNESAFTVNQVNCEEKVPEQSSETCHLNTSSNATIDQDSKTFMWEKCKSCVNRPPTPGPRKLRQTQSLVKSLTTVSDGKVRENVRQFSYSEERENGDSKSEYCMVTHSITQRPPAYDNKEVNYVGGALQHSLQENKEDKMLIHFSHKRSSLEESNTTKYVTIPEQDACSGSLEGTKSAANINPLLDFTLKKHNGRPLSADSACSHQEHDDIQEIKRSQSTLTRWSENDTSNEATCLSSLISEDSLVNTGQNATINELLLSSNLIFEAQSIPYHTDTHKLLEDCLEGNVSHDLSNRKESTLIAVEQKKKMKKSNGSSIKENIFDGEVNAEKLYTENGLCEHKEYFQGSICNRKGMHESSTQDHVSSDFDKHSQNIHSHHPGVLVEEKKISSSSRNNMLSKVEEPLMHDMGSQECHTQRGRSKGTKQMAKVKPRSIKKIALPPITKHENTLESRISHNHGISFIREPLGLEMEGPSPLSESHNATGLVNTAQEMNNSYLIHNSLVEIVDPTPSVIQLSNGMDETENAHVTSKKQKKRKKNKKNTNLGENKKKPAVRRKELHSLQPDECPPEICSHSLESYVQSWLQNIFPNSSLPAHRMKVLTANYEPQKEDSIVTDSINMCSNKDTELAVQRDVCITENSPMTNTILMEDKSSHKKEVTALEEECILGPSERQYGCVASTVDKIEEFSCLNIHQDSSAEGQVLYDGSKIEGMKTKLKVDIQGINIAIGMNTVDVAVQADAEFVSSKDMGTRPTDSRMPDGTLCCPHPSNTNIQKATYQCHCLQRSLSSPYASSAGVGSSPHVLLAWLVVLNLKDSLANILQNDKTHRSCSSAGIQTLLQSLKQIAITENADDLEAAVLNLQELTLNYELEKKEAAHPSHCLQAKELHCGAETCEGNPLKDINNTTCVCSDKAEHDSQGATENIITGGGISLEILNTPNTRTNRLCHAGPDIEHNDIEEKFTHDLNEDKFDKVNDYESERPSVILTNKERIVTFDEENPPSSNERIDTKNELSSSLQQNMDSEISIWAKENSSMGNYDSTVLMAGIKISEENLAFITSNTMEDTCQNKCIKNEKEVSAMGNDASEGFPPPSPVTNSNDPEGNMQTNIQSLPKRSKVKMIVQEMEHRRCADAPFEFRKCLQSPLSSDWSDYRQDSDDSIASGSTCKASSEINTESGEETVLEKPFKTGLVKRTIERLYGKSEINPNSSHSTGRPSSSQLVGNDSDRSSTPTKKDVSSFFQDFRSQNKTSHTRPSSSCSTSSQRKQNQHASAKGIPNSCFPLLQPINSGEVFNCDRNDSLNIYDTEMLCAKQESKTGVNCVHDDGVLLDKGRWLLKENHLVRKSPPENTGMYGNIDTTSADTMCDNTSDDVPYSHFKNQNLPIAEVSSSEVEDLAKPRTFRCNYFSMPHGSDSEPFHDDLQIKSKHNLLGNAVALLPKNRKELLSAGINTGHKQRNSDTCGNGPVSSAVELRLHDNKVHPQGTSSNAEVMENHSADGNHPNREQVREQDSLDKLQIICGQHCPILTVLMQPTEERSRGFAYCQASDIENQLWLQSLSTERLNLKKFDNWSSADKNNNVVCNYSSIISHVLIKDLLDRFSAKSRLSFNEGACNRNTSGGESDIIQTFLSVSLKTYISSPGTQSSPTEVLKANGDNSEVMTNSTGKQTQMVAGRDINNNVSWQQWNSLQELITPIDHSPPSTCRPSQGIPLKYGNFKEAPFRIMNNNSSANSRRGSSSEAETSASDSECHTGQETP